MTIKAQTSFERKVIALIIRAQMWSDAAKGISSTLIDSRYHAYHTYKYDCYSKKDRCICDVLNLLKKNRRCCVQYYIGYDTELRCAIVYFEVRVEGKKFQISFHSFNKVLINAKGAGLPMRWKGIEGSSRKAAEELQVIVCRN